MPKDTGEPALKRLLEEARRPRREPTLIESSRVGESRATGAAKQVVQDLGEQVRVVKCGVESRLGVKINNLHAQTCWGREHCADSLSKCDVGPDGRTPYERWKWTKQDTAESGENVHDRVKLRNEPCEEKLEARCRKGYFLHKYWRADEAGRRRYHASGNFQQSWSSRAVARQSAPGRRARRRAHRLTGGGPPPHAQCAHRHDARPPERRRPLRCRSASRPGSSRRSTRRRTSRPTASPAAPRPWRSATAAPRSASFGAAWRRRSSGP